MVQVWAMLDEDEHAFDDGGDGGGVDDDEDAFLCFQDCFRFLSAPTVEEPIENT